MFKDFSNWMHNTATVLFDDTKNDLRALPKTVRLQILIVLSALWSTAFSIWVFTVPMFVYGWLGMFLGQLSANILKLLKRIIGNKNHK